MFTQDVGYPLGAFVRWTLERAVQKTGNRVSIDFEITDIQFIFRGKDNSEPADRRRAVSRIVGELLEAGIRDAFLNNPVLQKAFKQVVPACNSNGRQEHNQAKAPRIGDKQRG